MSSYDYTFKVIILGDDSAGKTAFINKFCYNIFSHSERLSIGVDFHVKKLRSLDRILKLQLWDVVGEDRFRFLLPNYFLGANAAIFMYDITRPSTLKNISEWTRIIRERGGDIPIVLVGSKLHLEDSQAVSRQEAISVVENYNLSAFEEICPESRRNVDQFFEILGELLIKRAESYTKDDQDSQKPLEIIPIKIPSNFKINEYLELRLENDKTNIYVGGRLFNQCKYLLLDIPIVNKKGLDKIESIDEAAEKLDHTMERESYKYHLSPKVEFWGHCSNLQAWYENFYDTRILHRNLAFPLLRALVEAGDPLAKMTLKEEIAIRLESGYPSVVLYLINQRYLKYLNKEELDIILEKSKFIKSLQKWYLEDRLAKWLGKRIKAKIDDLKCNYCESEISNTSIESFLDGKPIKCEFCYTNILNDYQLFK